MTDDHDEAPSLLFNFAGRFLGRPLRRQRRTRRKNYPDDPTKEVFEAAESGDTDLLVEVFQQMNVNERASALETTDYMHSVQFASTNSRKCTPLMIASYMGHVNAVNCLVKHGADINAQNKQGDIALHFAVRRSSLQVAYNLLTLGATQVYNNERLTPLLLASNLCMTSMVDTFIERPECTKEQRIDALEFLGASCATTRICCRLINDADTVKAFQYVKRGMEERFQDPPHPLLKQPMEPVEAYQNRKESQTPEELAQIEGDADAILMESLIIRERILGTDNIALHDPIREVANYYDSDKKFDICIGLHKHIMEILMRCDRERPRYSAPLPVLYKKTKNGVSLKQEVLVEYLEKAFLEYEREKKMIRELDEGSDELRMKRGYLKNLLDVSLKLLQVAAKVELCKTDKNSSLTVFLRKLSCLNPYNENGNTLLHLAAVKQREFFLNFPQTFGFPCAKTVKLLVNTGFNVNAVNRNGDTPLHTAVTFKPKNSDEMNALTDILEILLDKGAHHDFDNNDGKTAMDMAATDDARRILSERKTLELKCIAARAVKKIGLPYLGVVPKTLEKYISMH